MADSPLVSRISSRVWRVVGALTGVGLLTLIVLVAAWADTPRVRYALMPCVHRMIHDTRGPAEAVFFGSSRMQFAVDPFTFADELGGDAETRGVANLARQQGRKTGQVYRQLVELDRERGITGPIVFEYAGGAAFADAYEPASVTYRALLENWNSRPNEPTFAKAHTLLRQLVRKLDVAVESALVGRVPFGVFGAPADRFAAQPQSCVQRPRAGENQVYRPPKYERAKRDLADRIAAEVGPEASWRDRSPKTWDLSRPAWNRQVHYIDEIVRFAEERDLPVFAVVIPGYLERRTDPQMALDFEERFGIPLLLVPADLREQLNADDGSSFRDRKHLNRRGWKIFTRWLAGAMRAEGWAG